MDEEEALLSALNLPLTNMRAVQLLGDNATELEFGNGQVYLTFPVDSVVIEISPKWRPN